MQNQEISIIQKIQSKIYVIRGQRVMLDSDLAELYGVETGALNRAVRRNVERFPPDFLFQITELEQDSLRCQIGILERGARWNFFGRSIVYTGEWKSSSGSI